MKGVVKYKGYEILHRHEFNRVYFSAWKGNKPIRGEGEQSREIQSDNRLIDWEHPLTEDEMNWLIEESIREEVIK
jgi:hypothetical protein